MRPLKPKKKKEKRKKEKKRMARKRAEHVKKPLHHPSSINHRP
jgi:hypothetical protein